MPYLESYNYFVKRYGLKTKKPVDFSGSSSVNLGVNTSSLPVYNVHVYGAKGDGATDDTTAIQNAINAANAAGGGTVFLPSGTYKTTDFLVPLSNVKIQGAGSGSTTIAGYGQQFSIMKNLASVASPTTDIEICDLKVDGTNVTNPSTYSASWKGIYLQHSKRLKIHGVYVYNTLATGIGVDYLVDSIIDRCVVDTAGSSFVSLGGSVGSNGIGIGMGAYAVEDLIVSNCIAVNCGNVGIMCEQQNDVGAVKAQYTTFANCLSYNNNIGYLNSGVSRVSFDNCWAWSNQRNGFKVNSGDIGASNIYNPQDCYWTGCYAYDNGSAGGYDGFLIQDDQQNIQQNLIYNLRFSKCVSSGNTSNGYKITDASKVTLNDCYAYNNAVHGLLAFSDNPLYPFNDLQIIGGEYFNNSQGSPNANDGIRIGSSGTGLMDGATVTNVRSYDDQQRVVTDGAMTASSNLLTSTTASFTSDDVGKTITITGAGGGGSTLSTTILSWTSKTQVRTVSNASTTVSGATVTIGVKTQRYGISIAGTTNTTNIRVLSNDLRNNRNAAFNTGAISTLEVRGNYGWNPIGQSSISVTASPFTYTNGNSPADVFINGGTVSAVVKGSTTLAAASPTIVHLEPNQSVVVTYSVAPTMAADVY